MPGEAADSPLSQVRARLSAISHEIVKKSFDLLISRYLRPIESGSFAFSPSFESIRAKKSISLSRNTGTLDLNEIVCYTPEAHIFGAERAEIGRRNADATAIAIGKDLPPEKSQNNTNSNQPQISIGIGEKAKIKSRSLTVNKPSLIPNKGVHLFLSKLTVTPPRLKVYLAGCQVGTGQKSSLALRGPSLSTSAFPQTRRSNFV